MRQARPLFAPALALALLALAISSADARNSFGVQTERYYTGPGTSFAVTPGTNFLLLGAPGNHDIFFYSAAGAFLRISSACGHELGKVPTNAAYGTVRMWEPLSLGGVCWNAFEGNPSASAFVYVDGF